MLVPKQGLSIEKQHEVAGRSLNEESLVALASYYHVSSQRVGQITRKCDEDPEFKSKALAAASLFYEMNPDKRPKAARASTHPASASRFCGGLAAMPAIVFPPQAPSQQIPAFNPSFSAHPGTLRGMSHAELNVIGAIRFLHAGQALTTGPAWTAHQQHQRPALDYVQAGQSTPRSCTSQGLSEIHRPAAGAAQPPAGAAQPPACACSVEELRPPTCAPAGDLMSFTKHVGNLRPIATPAQLRAFSTFARRQHSEFARCR
jgi:hypothetical protein